MLPMLCHMPSYICYYTTMIWACTLSFLTLRASEPEHALNLWTKMTINNNIVSTFAPYDAVILTCAWTGDKKYVHESFCLAKEILDSHQDVHGELLYVPDKHTFLVLLEGELSLGVTINKEVMTLTRLTSVHTCNLAKCINTYIL